MTMTGTTRETKAGRVKQVVMVGRLKR
jgi:hypothetical protein